MKITVLMENATCSDRFYAEHGLSLFIETDERKLLFDMGPGPKFLDNARALGIDPAEADAAFVSHGHYDHGGGLEAYLELGGDAPVYVSRQAFGAFVARTPRGLKDIGLNPALAEHERLVFVDDFLQVDDALTLFSNVTERDYFPKSNASLLACANGEESPDTFNHEQSLIIREGDKHVLVTGCSHCGIVNIMRKAENIVGGPLHAVIAGFHLMNPGTGAVEDLDTAAAVATFMAERPTRYFTFHCTGLAAYSVLRDHLGDRVNYLYSGSVTEL